MTGISRSRIAQSLAKQKLQSALEEAEVSEEDEELEEQGGGSDDEADTGMVESSPTDQQQQQQQLGRGMEVLDREIAAVEAGLEGFTKSDAASNNEGTLYRAIASERLQSLKRKRVELEAQAGTSKSRDGGEMEACDERRSGTNGECSSSAGRRKGVIRKGTHGSRSGDMRDGEAPAAVDTGPEFVETERDRLIRIGVLTPFDKIQGFERKVTDDGGGGGAAAADVELDVDEQVARSIEKTSASYAALAARRPSTKLVDPSELPRMEPPTREFRRLRRVSRPFSSVEESSEGGKSRKKRKEKRPQAGKKWRNRKDSDSEYEPSGDETGGREEATSADSEEDDEGGRNSSRRRKRRRSRSEAEQTEDGMEEQDGGEEAEEDVVLEGGLKVPGKIYKALFEYQKTGVKWLWELHCLKTGGIIGDEMGLGKTIQVISFLAALHHSDMYSPSIVVCPVTLLRQWKREVHKWYPRLKAEIMHDSAAPLSSGRGKKGSAKKEGNNSSEEEEGELEEDGGDASDGSEEEEGDSGGRGTSTSKGDKRFKIGREERWDSLIKRVARSKSGLLLTSYEQLRLFKDKLLDVRWGYAVLDEGHRIRNPDTGTTLVCKQLQTVHRIIMTGAPIQNKLTELWSLFDFVFPGKLGVLPVFELEFGVPIRMGGYANATPLQVSTAYKCAVVLRDLVMPYLLRRMKADVEAQLPKKTEQVLFCSLTTEQRDVYRSFIASAEVEQIFEGKRNSLYGIDVLRKICNHPDLLDRDRAGGAGGHPDYGNPVRSGKLGVLARVLGVWREQGHKALVFTQTQQMLDIVERCVREAGWVYRRMDGATAVRQRAALIDEFNESAEVFVFILTAKVGGLGTNLVGADRVVLYDPDWNPATDIQARERAWRIGQKREVTVYRLITRGTIEEKVYHRQIYKHFLTNRILRDPKQRRFFKSKDLRDLFTLQDDGGGAGSSGQTETAALFADANGEVAVAEEDGKGKGVVKAGRGGEGDDEAGQQQQKDGEDETKILKNLFGASGVHSAMDHDAILSLMDKEKVQVDQEASRVARRAAEALLQSRMQRGNDSVAVPTWTGRSGAAGAPAPLRRRFGAATNSAAAAQGGQAGVAPAALSSSALLARLRSTQQIAQDTRSADGAGSGAGAGRIGGRSRVVPAPPEVLARQLCTYLEEQGGSATSTGVVERFRERVAQQDVAMFRHLLKTVATLKKEGGESRWYLNPEYRGV